MKNRKVFKKFKFLVILLIFLSVSCKIDEFKWNELGIKEGWSTNVAVPLFQGNLDFKDFITDWYEYEDNYSFDDPLTVLEYDEYYHRTIPTSLIFDHSVIMNDFPLLIQGNYSIDDITMEFNVTSASPYPLNLELLFYNKLDTIPTGQPIVPESFDAGIMNGDNIDSKNTVRRVLLTPEQIDQYNAGNRVRLISWYTNNGFAKDTLSARYPIEVSIIVLGAIKNKNGD
jgi:hypothetical protein